MTITRRILVLLVILALPLWAAGGASGKPGKVCFDPPCNDKPPSAEGSVSLEITTNLPWAQEASDTVIYTVVVRNDSAADVVVTSTLSGDLGTVAAGETKTFIEDYAVAPHYEDREPGPDPITLTNTVTAEASGGEVASASVDVDLWYETLPCDFNAPIPGACIWTPDSPGDWTVAVTPTATRPTNVMITLRDHIPGNWCASGANEKWRPGQGPVQTTFSIPDWEAGPLGAAVCPIGGAGGDFFGVGTPSSFFLVADGWVTVTKAG